MGRPRKNASVVKRPDQDVILRRIHESIGDDELFKALDGESDHRAKQLLELLLDPEYSNLTLPTAAQKVGLTRREVVDIFRRAKLDEAIVRMAKHLPDVMEDTAIDARSADISCWQCEGTGRVKKNVCPTCKGLKMVRRIGDADSRKMVFESAGLIGKRGPLLAQQFVSLNSETFEPLEKVVGAARKVLEGRVVDGSSTQDDTADRPPRDEQTTSANR